MNNNNDISSSARLYPFLFLVFYAFLPFDIVMRGRSV